MLDAQNGAYAPFFDSAIKHNPKMGQSSDMRSKVDDRSTFPFFL
jgi:hypothetical protein